jgi:hypothetical protein
MAFEDREEEFGALLGKMQNRPADWRELYELIRQKLGELKAYGMPLPADLVQFEQDLEAEFAATDRDDERKLRVQDVIAQRGRRS